MKKLCFVLAAMLLAASSLTACLGLFMTDGDNAAVGGRTDAAGEDPPQLEQGPQPDPAPPVSDVGASQQADTQPPPDAPTPDPPQPPPDAPTPDPPQPPPDAPTLDPPQPPPDAPTLDPPDTSETTGSVFTFPYAFSAEDLYGNPITESSLGEKELYLVYLWATW